MDHLIFFFCKSLNFLFVQCSAIAGEIAQFSGKRTWIFPCGNQQTDTEIEFLVVRIVTEFVEQLEGTGGVDDLFAVVRSIGSVSWPNGYWVHHPLTSYLDVQMLDEGRLILTRDGHETVITGPTLVIIPPGEHKLAADTTGVCRKRYLGLQGAVVVNNLPKLNLDKVHILPGFQNPEFDELFNALLQMMREKNSEKVSDLSVLAYEMLLLLSHCTEQQPFPEELAWAVRFIHREFASIGSLADICLFCNRAKSTLQGQFKRYMNTTPMQYLTEVRMNHAAKQLRNTLMPIKEIAEICGYSDQLYFSSTFKKHFHCSPRTYRKAAGVPEPEIAE